MLYCSIYAAKFTSDHPMEYKLAAYRYFINRMHTLPISEQNKQREINLILQTAEKNDFPRNFVTKLNKNIIHKMHHKQYNKSETQQTKTWIILTYCSPLVRNTSNVSTHRPSNRTSGHKYSV